LWALPIMCQIAIILNLQRLSSEIIRNQRLRAEADAWADRVLLEMQRGHQPMAQVLARHDRHLEQLAPAHAVQLLQRFLDQGPSAACLLEWLEERLIEGVTVVEAPSERTLARAMSRDEGVGIVDTAPGDERIVQSAVNSADAVVIPTRAGGVEFARVAATLEMIPARTPRGVVICSARLGTNDLDETIAWWKTEKVAIWGVIPERVGIASGPEARLYREGIAEYDAVLRRVLRRL